MMPKSKSNAKVKTPALPPPTLFQRSPIDIVDAIAAVLPPIEFAYKPIVAGDIVESPTGHGHNIAFKVEVGGIRVGTVEAKLIQLHFHAASEHHVSGQEFPLELHMVHEIVNPRTVSTLLVVAVLFSTVKKKQVSNYSRDVTMIFKSLVFDIKSDPTMPFQLNHLLPKDPLGYFGYYRYEGSLTTGSLDEKVSWLVLRQTVQVVQSDVAPLIKAATHEDLKPQDLNRRFVLRNF